MKDLLQILKQQNKEHDFVEPGSVTKKASKYKTRSISFNVISINSPRRDGKDFKYKRLSSLDIVSQRYGIIVILSNFCL
jgi:hypothetical protein